MFRPMLCRHDKCQLQVSERFTPEDEVVLTVIKCTNHPQFKITEGPRGGHDISTYVVDEELLKKPGTIQKGKLYPACLPSKAHKSMRGVFAGRLDTIGQFYFQMCGQFLFMQGGKIQMTWGHISMTLAMFFQI